MKVKHSGSAEITWVELVALARKQFLKALNLPEDEFSNIEVCPDGEGMNFKIKINYQQTKKVPE